MSDTLGKTLVAMRVKKGLSVEEVSAVTRINARFVRLIEDDQYDQLPGEVFIKGLLRSYAGVVGLSGDEVVARYNALGVHIKDRSPELLVCVPLRPESRLLPKILFSILAVLAAAGVIYYYAGPLEPYMEKPFTSTMNVKKPIKKQANDISPNEVSKTDAAPAPKPVQGPRQGPEPKKEPKPELKGKAAQPQQPSPVATAQSLSAPVALTTKPESKPAQTRRSEEKPVNNQAQPADNAKHKLTVTASDVSWISVIIDGGAARQIFLNAGETASWMGEKGFRISIGNAIATKVYLDGAEIKIKNAMQNVIKEMNIPVNKDAKPEGAEG
jgi:cytoskeletal protein RodZ